MAIMIPETCPSKASQGEKRLFRLLAANLPNSFTVWYEPVIQGRYPDFTILSGTFGLLLIEVKGWYPKYIRQATNHEVELERVTGQGSTYTETVANPIRQVRDYTYDLVDLLKNEPLLRQLRGSHKGKLLFPFGFGILFSNITRHSLEELGLSPLFTPVRAICRNELQQWESGGDQRKMIRRLKELFTVDFSFQPLTTDQLNLIHGSIHKEVVIRVGPATRQSFSANVTPPPGAKTLEVLDAEQERIAKSIGDGHRIFFGVAGSGKTILLLARAKLIAEQDADKNVLLLCYNRSLAAYLRSRLTEGEAFSNIELRTFHSWASATTGLRKRPDERFEDFEERLVTGLLQFLASASDDEKYDAVLVDEAHDFHPEWFRCCVAALRDAAAGDLVIAVDGSQSLYGRPRSFTWKSVQVNAVGRSRKLAVNYRNTREILNFAWEVAQAPLADYLATETHVRVHPLEAKRSGPPVVYRACHGTEEEQRVIEQVVLDFTRNGISETDICVLYPRESGSRIASLFRRIKQSSNACWITDETDRSARDTFMTRPGVRLSTVHSAKGLEFPVVVFSALDQLPDQRDRNLQRDSNLLYVGLTRATSCLVITWARKNFFAERVVKSKYAVELDASR